MHNREGTTLRDALAQAGFADRPRAMVDPARYRGYLEAHIEQGAELEDTGKRIGIVTAIVGSHRFRIVFEGVQNHAGTTRMAIRKDAGVALVNLAHAIYQRFPAVAGPRTVWTTGRITLDPGAAEHRARPRRDAVPVPRHRSRNAGKAGERAGGAGRGGDSRSVQGDDRRTRPIDAESMDAGFQDALERAAERHAPGLHVRMPSGAGHDAQILAERMKSAMLFVPSIGGISHHYAENTKDEDIVLGCQVFADAAADIVAAETNAG